MCGWLFENLIENDALGRARVGWAKAKAVPTNASENAACAVGTSLALLCPPYEASLRYLNEIASPLRSAFAIRPICWPESSSTAPF